MAGDLVEFEGRQGNDPYDWTMTFTTLDIQELCELTTELERAEAVQFKLIETCVELDADTPDVYQVRSTNFA